MNLIEQAAKRLLELEKAGIEVPATPQARPRAQAPRYDAGDGRREPVLEGDAGANRRRIDFARLQAAGFIVPGVAESKLLQEFRVIKRPLIRNALGKSAAPVANGNLIMVTSSVPGEGKSFVSLNLAMSIAMEVDSTVLLVDADVVAPSIPRLLDIKPAKGLMDLLRKPESRVGDALLRTNVERLSLLLAGTPSRGASELLASETMAKLVKELSSRYPDRIVIFDSPPLLATTESRVLASHMGQIVVVVEAEGITHGTLESALSTIESCEVVMTMLNKAPESEVGSYYGSYGSGREE